MRQTVVLFVVMGCLARTASAHTPEAPARERRREVIMPGTPGLTVGRPQASSMTWFVLSTVLLGAMCTGPVSAQSTGSDTLNRTIALYATLNSYADTGTVVREAPGIVDRSKFRTYFRRSSLDFLFDYQNLTSQSGAATIDMSRGRIVLWMINGELQSFNKEQRTHESIPRASGKQPAALQNAGAGTKGTSVLIPSLIFSKAQLPGTLLQITEAADSGFESVNGHRCRKIVGIAAQYYPSGQMTNVRRVTVWVDAETLLVRKVFEDTPKGYPAGAYSTLTVTIEPQANPTLDEGKFQFTVPDTY